MAAGERSHPAVAAWQPRDPDYAARVRTSFDKQSIMTTIGAELLAVHPGAVEIALVPAPHILQQHGFVHAGVVVTIADSAAGFAALSLFPPGAAVLTTELKINLLAPAAGDRLVARGRVVRSGRTLTVCLAEVTAERAGRSDLCALLTATMMSVEGRPGLAD